MAQSCLQISGDVLTTNQNVIDVARCWRAARDHGDPVQPSLFHLLVKRSWEMLAPVFDSLLTFYEAMLGRPVEVGYAQSLSFDEQRLVDLLSGSQRLNYAAPDEVACAFQSALCSTRLMICQTARGIRPAA